MWFDRYNSLNFIVYFFQVNMQSHPEHLVSLKGKGKDLDT